MGRTTIISHRIKIQPHKIRKQEIVLRRIPRSISDIQRVGRVRAAPGRRQIICWRHSDDAPEGSSISYSLSLLFCTRKVTMRFDIDKNRCDSVCERILESRGMLRRLSLVAVVER
jgi:hypothetical protein